MSKRPPKGVLPPGMKRFCGEEETSSTSSDLSDSFSTIQEEKHPSDAKKNSSSDMDASNSSQADNSDQEAIPEMDDQEAMPEMEANPNNEHIPAEFEESNLSMGDLVEPEEESPTEVEWLSQPVAEFHELHSPSVYTDCSFPEENAEPEYTIPTFCSSSDGESSCEEEQGIHNEAPLYEGSSITVSEMLLAILSFAVRHNISGVCLSDLLTLISLACQKPILKNPSLYLFKKHFSKMEAPVTFHYFCSGCYSQLDGKGSKCKECSKYTDLSDVSFFVEISLVSQIQTLFSRESFYNDLQHRFTRKKEHVDNIEDIYDGRLYREFVEKDGKKGFLSSCSNFSLMWNSDGIPVYKSSKTSLWPVYLSFNELSYEKRMQKENMLIAGLWYGHKPQGNILLKPLHQSLKEIYKGIKVEVPGFSDPITVRGMLLCGTCDLPAKCLFTCSTQYNGAFGCQYCKVKGESVDIKKGGAVQKDTQGKKKHVWVYKFDPECPLPLRNHQEMVQAGKEACELRMQGDEGASVFGIKGPTILTSLMPDAVRGMAIDVMHTVFQGNAKKLVDLWFSPSHHKEPFSLSKYVHVIDQKLAAICPPRFVQRSIRSISDHLGYWKASEFKVWVLYISVVVLHGVMDPKYLENYYDFVSSIFRLCKSSISQNDLIECNLFLRKFVEGFQELYGYQHMNMNVHLLLHLTSVVSDLGPLWAYSCFPFENMNGQILQMIHGSRYVEVQVASATYSTLSLPYEATQLQSKAVRAFCLSAIHQKYRLKGNESISEGIFSVGAYKVLKDPPEFIKEALIHKESGQHYQIFHKVKKGPFLFVSEMYEKKLKTNSHYVSFMSDDVKKFGLVKCFIRSSSCECLRSCTCQPSEFLAIINVGKVYPFSTATLSSSNISFIQRIQLTAESIAINVRCLKGVLFKITDENQDFICETVNTVEFE